MSAVAATIATGLAAWSARQADKQTPRLRLLSYNIQTGIATSRYRHYLTHSWKHLLPCPQRLDNLDRIAALIQEYDIVGLQETDGGSLRSGFINQTEYLALRARFPYWYDQRNRNLGHLAQHSLGVLSRYRSSEITEFKLPGVIPGRGALAVRYGAGRGSLLLVTVHLALGRRARRRQLEFIADLVRDFEHVVLMGDLNCEPDSREIHWLWRHAGLREPIHGLHTFPSWRPRRSLDHILVSESVEIRETRVVNAPISDHLPIAMEVILPPEVALKPVRWRGPQALPLAAAAGA